MYLLLLLLLLVFCLTSYRVKLVTFCIPYLSIYDIRILVVPPFICFVSDLLHVDALCNTNKKDIHDIIYKPN
jgi:hypothetical protein